MHLRLTAVPAVGDVTIFLPAMNGTISATKRTHARFIALTGHTARYTTFR